MAKAGKRSAGGTEPKAAAKASAPKGAAKVPSATLAKPAAKPVKKSAVAPRGAAAPKPVVSKSAASKPAASKPVASKSAASPKASAAKKASSAKAATKPSKLTVSGGDLRQAEVATPSSPAPEQLSLQGLAPADPGTSVEVGDQVPTFNLVDQTGTWVSDQSLRGQKAVLYFYPKDDTPGCTAEACGFRDELEAFTGLGARILGVSPDKPASHGRFASKYDLNFSLLADVDLALCKAFGVWKLKKNYGREYWGVERSTFVIDEAGKVTHAWRGVRVAGHVAEVMQAVSGG